MYNFRSKFFTGLPVIMGVLVIAFFMNGGTDFRLIPVHHDDYTNLSSSIFDMFQRGNFVRPVSTFLIAVLAYFGENGYLVGQLLFLSIYILLVNLFLSRFFGIKANVIFLILSTLLVSTIPNLVEYHFYTGLMTNLSSAVFGMFALVLWQQYKGEKAKWAVFLLLVLSALAKEDFVLPFVIYTAYLYFNESHSSKRMVNLKWSFLSALVLLFSFVSNKVMGSAFVSSDTSHYAVSLRISDIFKGYEFYLLRNEFFSICILTLLIVSFLFILASKGKIVSIKKTIVVFTMVFSLVGPYTLLPNHYAQYYSFMWFVWVVILIAVFVNAILSSFITKDIYNLAGFSISIAILFYFFSVIFSVQRISVTNWYENQQSTTKNVLESLKFIQPYQTASGKKVYILTPPRLSPWSHSSGQYLERVLNFKNDWVVCVSNSDGFYQIGNNVGTVSIISLDSFSMDSVVDPVFIFRMDGTVEKGHDKNG